MLERLEDGGFRVEMAPTTGPGDATRLARKAVTAGADAVFALGGDGTLREAAAGLLGTDVPLGPLPGGTANVLTLALGLPRHPADAAAVLASAEVRSRPRSWDVGVCAGAPFLMMASAGLDAEVVCALHPLGKRRLGRLGIVGRGLGCWWNYTYPPIAVRADDEDLGRASFVTVANIPLHGGPFRLAPHARPHDRRLDLVLFRGTGRAATLGLCRDVLRGAHLRRPDVEAVAVGPGERVTLTAAGGPEDLRLQIDGDPGPTLPVTLGLAPERLRILAPPGPAGLWQTPVS